MRAWLSATRYLLLWPGRSEHGARYPRWACSLLYRLLGSYWLTPSTACFVVSISAPTVVRRRIARAGRYSSGHHRLIHRRPCGKSFFTETILHYITAPATLLLSCVACLRRVDTVLYRDNATITLLAVDAASTTSNNKKLCAAFLYAVNQLRLVTCGRIM